MPLSRAGPWAPRNVRFGTRGRSPFPLAGDASAVLLAEEIRGLDRVLREVDDAAGWNTRMSLKSRVVGPVRDSLRREGELHLSDWSKPSASSSQAANFLVVASSKKQALVMGFP